MSEVTDAPVRSAANEDSRTSPHGSHIWYELITPDPVGAKSFYDAVIGWDIEPQPAGEMDYRMIRAAGDNVGGVMRLNDDMAQHGAKPVWLGYVAVDDVDATVAKVKAKGGKTHLPAFDIPDVGRIAMVADPQGNTFYVMKPTPPKGDEDKVSTAFSTSTEGHVNWNELTTSDPTAARSFYGELFGWTSDEFMPMGELGEYRFFAHQGTTIGALCQPGPDGSFGWRYYIRVPSISKAADAVKAGGGQVSMGPHEVPGGDHIIIGNDPQGAEFALVGKA
jgi:predicted enzyme related to lactoylglutathione lyase